MVILISVDRDQTEIRPRYEIDPRSTAKFGQFSPKLLEAGGTSPTLQPEIRYLDRPEIRDQTEIGTEIDG